jgi:tetratricopeptide (TPR) repeat protein
MSRHASNRTIALAVILLLLTVMVVLKPGLLQRDKSLVANIESGSGTAAGTEKRPIETSFPRQPYAMKKFAAPREHYESAWHESIKSIYRTKLSAKRPDIIVFPFEVQAHPIDKIGRSLITRKLNHELRGRTVEVVANFDMVDRAMGYNRDVFLAKDIEKLVEATSPRLYVRGYVGYTEPGSMDVTIVVNARHSGDADDYEEILRKTWQGLAFSDESYPYETFTTIVSDVVALVLPVSTQISSHTGEVVQQPEPRFPVSPEELFDVNNKSVVQAAMELQLLGALTPKLAVRERHRLFERSLLLVGDIPDTNRHYPLLKARALFYLSRRPGALKAIENITTPETQALHDYLNGNLPEMQSSLEDISTPYAKLLGRLEFHDLATSYEQGPEHQPTWQKTFFERYPEWSILIAYKLLEGDEWQQGNNAAVKWEMDRRFPQPMFSVESAAAELSSRRGSTSVELVMTEAVVDHMHASLEALSPDEHDTIGATRYDYLHLLESIARAGAVRNIKVLLDKKGLPERASTLVDGYLAFYQDQPDFLFYRYRADHRLWIDARGQRHTALQKRLIETLPKIMDLSYEHDAEYLNYRGWVGSSSNSFNLTHRSDRLQIIHLSKRLSYYEEVFPPRFQNFNLREDLDGWRRYLSYVNDDFHALLSAYANVKRKSQTEATALVAEYKHRFHGHPDRQKLIVQANTEGGDRERERYLQFYRSAIDSGTRDWDPYFKLGYSHALDGDYEKALQVYQQYPPFRDGPNDDPVALSNRAQQAGSTLYWRGAYRQAIPLYERAASFNTGSDAEMMSLARIATIHGDYRSAARHNKRRGERYNSAYGFGDYLSFLHMLGESRNAWTMFDSLIGSFHWPAVWTSAIVGHRIQGTDQENVVSWLSDGRRLVKKSKVISFTSRFGLMALTMDRPPNDQAPRIVDTLAEGYHWRVQGPPKGALVKFLTVKDPEGIPYAFGSFYPIEDLDLAAGDVLESEYAIFARAYNAIKKGDYASAYETLTKIYYFYRLGASPTYDYAFPYLVRAGLKGRQREKIDVAISMGRNTGWDKSRNSDSFHYHLALAFVEGEAGNHGAALEQLNIAFRVRPHTDALPVMTWFQAVETCLWLHDDFGDPRYLALALQRVKDYQIIAPMYAWAYAVEAKYSQVPEQRLRALGIALFLDRDSWLLAEIPEVEKRRAREWYTRNDPFKEKSPDDVKPAGLKNAGAEQLKPLRSIDPHVEIEAAPAGLTASILAGESTEKSRYF